MDAVRSDLPVDNIAHSVPPAGPGFAGARTRRPLCTSFPPAARGKSAGADERADADEAARGKSAGADERADADETEGEKSAGADRAGLDERGR